MNRTQVVGPDAIVLDEAPVSIQQEIMLDAVAHAPKPQVWNVPTRIELTGECNVAALRTAVAELVGRHVALRCRFVRTPDGPYRQQELAATASPLRIDDLRAGPADRRAARAGEICQEMAETPFDLGRSTTPRCRLLRLDTDRWILMVVTHHIGTDGWALSLVLTELAELYRSAATGTPSRLSAPGAQCTDYARWQQATHDQAAQQRALAFWRTRLANVAFGLELPTDRPRPAAPTGSGGTVRLAVPGSTRQLVAGVAAARHVTPFAVAAAALAGWLADRAGTREVVLSVSYAHRERREFESLVSCTRIGLAVPIVAKATFPDLVTAAAVATLEALGNAVPAGWVLRELCAAGRTDVPDQLPVGFAFQNYPGPAVEFPGSATTVTDVAPAATRLDLTFGLVECADPADGYQAWLEYSRDLWHPDSATRLLRSYLKTLAERCAESAP